MDPKWANPLPMGATSPLDPRQGGERSDRDLVLDFKDGCGDAYESIYRRHHERVHRTCLRILGNHADAVEATQETFLKAFRALGRFNGQYQLGAWLARIASNVAFDQLRARQRSVNIVAGTEDVVHLDDGKRDLGSEVTDRIGVRETLEEIQPLHAEALRLQAVEGLSHKQIADRLGMSPAQVKSLLHRSRHSFKRAWENASGWALAPFGFLKDLRTRNSEPLMNVSPATGVLLERIAASAMAAVVAVAGWTSSNSDRPEDRSQAAPAYVTPEIVLEDDFGGARVTPTGSAARSEARATNVLEDATDKVTELIEVERVLPSDLNARDGDDRNGRDGSITPPAAKKPLPKPARKVVNKVEKLVPDDGSPETTPLSPTS